MTNRVSSARSHVHWFGGVGWEGTASTELRIIGELESRFKIVWFAPPAHSSWAGWWHGRAPSVQVRSELVRVRLPALPGITRWPLSALTTILTMITARRLARRFMPSAVVVASPTVRLPSRSRVPKILYVTDDWIVGARLMGLSARRVARTLRVNARRADAIVGVSAPVLHRVQTLIKPHEAPDIMTVISNGTSVMPAPARRAREAVAVLTGQLNPRIDLEIIEAVADAGINVRIVGPCWGEDSEFSKRLDALAAHPHVEWRGAVAPHEVSAQLEDAGVGLVPYVDNEFNRASSPLKTLDYLAAGLSVVSTDLPASRNLGTHHVRIADSGAAFVTEVTAAIRARDDGADADARHAFAMTQSWDVRAASFAEVIRSVQSRSSGRARKFAWMHPTRRMIR